MDFWRIQQMIWPFLHFLGTGILAFALVTVVTWPQLRGRGLLVTALAVQVVAHAGFLMLGLFNVVATFGGGGLNLPGEVVQVGFLLLALISVVGYGLLLVALISLGRVLRDIQLRGGLADTALPPPIREVLRDISGAFANRADGTAAAGDGDGAGGGVA